MFIPQTERPRCQQRIPPQILTNVSVPSPPARLGCLGFGLFGISTGVIYCRGAGGCDDGGADSESGVG